MRVLVTGGAGYIGAHTCVELLKAGHDVVTYDNYCNSSPLALDRVQQIAGRRLLAVQGDIRAVEQLAQVLKDSAIEAVIHFAGLKAVGESVENPMAYYDTNVNGTYQLLRAMEQAGVSTLVFSSSATVYGQPQFLPYTEAHPLAPESPYGRSKRIVEDMLRDYHLAHPQWRIAVLRYFNPVGAHESGLIGEDPQGIPNNLMPFIAQVAVGRRPHLNIWGNDYATTDGTGVRDYIHVVDLADGHVKALDALATAPQCLTVNLGAGKGYSVLEMVRAFERMSGQTVPYQVAPRRAGDLAEFYADPSLANTLFGWTATRTVDDMCGDHWRWQKNNPTGYDAKLKNSDQLD